MEQSEAPPGSLTPSVPGSVLNLAPTPKAEGVAARSVRKNPSSGAILSRISGPLVSFLVHGSLVLLAFWSIAGSRSGRGGGDVGGSGGSPSAGHDVVFHLGTEERMEPGPRSPDARSFGEPTPEEIPPTPVPPPPSPDFLKDFPGETAIAKPVPVDAATNRSRASSAYEKLPPSAGGSGDAAPAESASGDGATRPGNSAVSGSGGDTGGAGDGADGALYMPRPDYPPAARRRGVEGVVVIAVEVHGDGHCEGAHVVSTSGSEALDEAALGAVRRWKYEPRPGGTPETRRVRFVFKLQ